MFAHTSWNRSSDPAGVVAVAGTPSRGRTVSPSPSISETYACTSSASLEPKW